MQQIVRLALQLFTFAITVAVALVIANALHAPDWAVKTISMFMPNGLEAVLLVLGAVIFLVYKYAKS